MNFNKLTLKAQEAVQAAQELASNAEHQTLEPSHILASLLLDAEGVVRPIITKIGVNADFLRTKAEEVLASLPKVSGFSGTHISNDTQRLFQEAFKEASALNDEYVSTEHLLLALVESKGASGQLLRDQGITKQAVSTVLKEMRGGRRVTDQSPEEKYQSLEKYARNLNEEARKGKDRPCDRTRGGDSSRSAGTSAKDEEQPRSYWRTWCW